MFTSARASLTALCLSVRAIDGHPVNASPGLQLARDAAMSQATACIDWIKAISSASNDVSDRSGGDIACGSMVQNRSQYRSSSSVDVVDVAGTQFDVARVVNPHVQLDTTTAPLIQPNCEEKDLVVVEEASSSMSLTPTHGAKLKPPSCLLDKPPQADVVLIASPAHLDNDKPTNHRCFGISQLQRRSISARIKESNSLIVESISSHMKALGLQEKQPDLKDSDFLFDADFEAFLP
ncbi:hypothetical protein GOP47_0024087 [Adiantum capillus-veneris]|uniref:Uncharacterized protein n=1 Tax=Adiantum capillus-veneris TaxID=13818 RepID=A0A9D4Z5T1_ADICA|nr:hypothetical protein GOP47_0024087 [Adiantum capillus-veneris]